MTLSSAGVIPDAAVIDGVDVDAVAAVVRGCAGVSGLDGGPYGGVATYLPGRTVPGIVVRDGRVGVQVRSAWGVEAPLLAAMITAALAPLTGGYPVDVAIADIDDPPSTPPPRVARRTRRADQSPGLPPG